MGAIHHALSISELLNTIFNYSSSDDNLNNALACRRWTDGALNARWRVINNPCNLLRLLAPLETLEFYDGNADHPIFIFTRPIASDDWKCFDKYAWRVHELDFRGYCFDPSVFEAIFASRPRDILLPNLRELGPTLDAYALPLFASPSLRTVYPGTAVEDGTDVDDEFLTLAFPCLPTVAPHLEGLFFTLSTPFPTDEDEASLCTTIRQLTSLKELHLPGSWLSPALTEAIAPLPKLVTFDTRNSDSAIFIEGDEKLFSLSLPTGSFPVLEQLHIDVQYRRFVSAFSQASPSLSLSSLSVASPTEESSSDLARLLDVIARSFPPLEDLHISSFPKDPSSILIEPATLVHLAPLLSCSKLQKIAISHPSPFTLYTEDVVSIAKALPSLKEFHLGQYPEGETTTPTLHLSVLSALASLDTSIETFSLDLDTSVDDRLTVDGITSFAKLTKLRRLSVGSSPLAHPIPVAVYLSRVLPSGCTVSCRDPHFCKPDTPEAYLAMRWERTIQFFSAVQGVRDEERQWRPDATQS